MLGEVVAGGGEGRTSAELSKALGVSVMQASTSIGDLLDRGLVEYRRRDDHSLYTRARSLVYVATLSGVDVVQRG